MKYTIDKLKSSKQDKEDIAHQKKMMMRKSMAEQSLKEKIEIRNRKKERWSIISQSMDQYTNNKLLNSLSNKEEFDLIYDVGSNWDNIMSNLKEEY